MFRKIKENPYYKKFKEMRADPKLRPITSLIFWLVFMVLLIIFVRVTSSSVQRSTSTEVKQNLSSYEFTYTNNSGVIFGKADNDKLEFILGNNRYYYDGENVYLINGRSAKVISNFDLNVLKITPKFIENLISNLTYNTDGEAKQYAVPLSRFINLYEFDVEVNSSKANNYNVLVNVYEKDNEIYMYKLDLSNYYKFRSLNDSGILTIDIYDDLDEVIGGV